MPYIRRRSRFKRTLVKFTKLIGIAALVVLAVVALSLLVRYLMTKEKVVSQTAPMTTAAPEIQEPADARSEISGNYVGLCKKESVHSVEDLRKTVLGDSVLARHFAGFNWQAARLGKQDEEVWTFVSYREGADIRRTLNPVRLPKGDGYVTDGVRMVRTYCCNDYVIAPPPVELSLAQPLIEQVDGPPRRKSNTEPVVDPPPPLSYEPPAEGSVEPIPPFLRHPPYYPPHPGGGPIYLPYSSNGGTTPGEEHPPIVTPEPGTFLLMGAGVAVMVLLRRLRRKRAD